MMKMRSFLASFFVFLSGLGFGQNLVPNGGFEDYTSLPNGYAQFYLATGWLNLNGNLTGPPFASPDYFHTLGSVGTAFGQIAPHSGDGQMGLCTYHAGLGNFREYISIELTTAMIPGQTYQLTFYLTNGFGGSYTAGVDNFGVHFSVGPLGQAMDEPVLVTPQLEIPGIIYHENFWQEYVFTFVANNAANYITIGNFEDDFNTSVSGGTRAYYFIDDIELITDASPTLEITGNDSICAGETALLTAFNDTVLAWADSLAPGLIIGTDSVIVVSPENTTTYFAYGANDTASFTVNVIDLPEVNLGSDTSICPGSALIIDATTPGATYLWSDDSSGPQLEVSAEGLYWVEVTVNGCSASDTIAISDLPVPTAVISGNEFVCPGDTAFFTVELSGEGQWSLVYAIDGAVQDTLSSDSPEVSVPAWINGVYTVVSVEDAWCANVGEFSAVLENPPVASAVLSGGGTYCLSEGGNLEVAFEGSAPWTFNYAIDGVPYGPVITSDSLFSLSANQPGTYELTQLSDAFCEGEVSGEATVAFFEPPLALISPGGSICPGESFNLSAEAIGGVPPYTYQWLSANNGNSISIGQDLTLEPEVDEGVFVVVSDACGATGISDTSWVEVYDLPQTAFSFDPSSEITVFNTTVAFYNEVQQADSGLWWEFSAQTENGDSQLIFNSDEPNPQFTFPDAEPGIYEVCLYVTSAENCQAYVCQTIEIAGEFIFYMPNAFTPNEDGVNDLFGPVMEGVDPEGYEFVIVNRWGETVFSTNDPDQKWNGSGIQGSYYAPNGVYAWSLRCKEQSSVEFREFSGKVTLIR